MRALLSRIVPSALVLPFAGAALAGAVVEDFTGDGRRDVVVSGSDPAGAVRLLGLQIAGEVTDLTAAHGLDGIRGAGELRAVDADDDGRLDLLVLPAEGAAAGLRLLVRDERDVFRDVTERAGLGGVDAPTAAVFGDLDLDGELDLVVGTATAEPPYVRVWRGAGDGTFREITESAGVTAAGPCAGVALGDTDFDDLPELYLSLRDAPNALWRNAGAGVFAPVETAAPLAEPGASGPAWFVDYDNDRDWDLLVAPPPTGGGPRLFQNERDRGWSDVTAERGLDSVDDMRRIVLADLDNDGFEELLGETAGAIITLRNESGRRFAPWEDDGVAPDLVPGEVLTAGDLDYDGDQDVLVSVRGISEGAIFGPGVHRNPGNDNLWVSVGVEGDRSNRYGEGCLVRVLATDARGRRRDYFRRVGETASMGGSLRLDIGLGRAERILWVQVFFPGTGKEQSYFQPKDRCTLIVKEGAPDLVTVFHGAPRGGRRSR